MKPESKTKLDKLQRKERLKNIIPLFSAFLVLLVVITGILLYKYSPGKTIEVTGVVKSLHGVPVPKRGEMPYLIVKLDSGKTIQVKKPNYIIYKKEERVQLLEIKTSVFGNVRYEFKSYLKE
jgi:hypothetical protein